MIEMIEGAPGGVLAFKAVGEVHADDYRALESQVERMVVDRNEIRCVYVLGPEFTGYSAGAAWEDFDVGMAHITKWKRCAVVTDKDWVRHLVKAFGWIMAGHMRLFSLEELDAAMEWAAQDAESTAAAS